MFSHSCSIYCEYPVTNLNFWNYPEETENNQHVDQSHHLPQSHHTVWNRIPVKMRGKHQIWDRLENRFIYQSSDWTHSHFLRGSPVCDEYGNLKSLLRIKEQHNASPVIACMHVRCINPRIIINRIKSQKLPAKEQWEIHQKCYSWKTGNHSNQKPIFSVTSLLNSTGWNHSWWSRRQKRYSH